MESSITGTALPCRHWEGVASHVAKFRCFFLAFSCLSVQLIPTNWPRGVVLCMGVMSGNLVEIWQCYFVQTSSTISLCHCVASHQSKWVCQPGALCVWAGCGFVGWIEGRQMAAVKGGENIEAVGSMQPNELLTRHSSMQMRAQLLPELLRKTLMVRGHREAQLAVYQFRGRRNSLQESWPRFFFFFNVKKKVAASLQMVWLYLCITLKEKGRKNNN